jgi:hypothetical protein
MLVIHRAFDCLPIARGAGRGPRFAVIAPNKGYGPGSRNHRADSKMRLLLREEVDDSSGCAPPLDQHGDLLNIGFENDSASASIPVFASKVAQHYDVTEKFFFQI